MSYADRTRRPPRSLTDDEQRRVLRASGKHSDTFRDHMIFSLALGTGLREGEIVALDVGDVSRPGHPRRRALRTIRLRYYARKGRHADRVDAEAQIVHLPDGTYYKLDKFLRSRAGAADTDPLFVGRCGERLSTRRVREVWREWQARAGLDHLYPFHAARHTAISNVYRATKGNIRIAQRVARHARIDTTTRYEHASAEEVAAAVRGLTS